MKNALARAKTELARLRLQREKLLAGDTADTSSLFRLYPAGRHRRITTPRKRRTTRGRTLPERCGYGSALDAAMPRWQNCRQTDPPAS
ncbi:MAG: hypothetical protein ACLS9Y_07375 [Ruthenibacterium lactatiformans]